MSLATPADDTPGAPRAGATTDAPGAWYVVVLLGVVYALNIADRYMISVLIEPIKADLHISDSQIAFLTGAALALFYVTAGVPIAVLADRTNRTRLIAAALVAWSCLTAVCGLTRGYLQMLLARILVGVGEAGGTPPSTSLISDFFSWRRRALALSVYSVGASVGSMIGSSAGWISDHWGWRRAFYVLGLPGILVAIVLLLTVREPKRGRLDARHSEQAGAGFGETLVYTLGNPAMLHCLFAGFLYCLWAWGLMWWTPSYLVRSHQFSLSEAGNMLGLINGAGGTLVLILTSLITSRLARSDPRSLPRFIAVACTLGTVPSIIAIASHDASTVRMALWFFIPITYAVFGPPYALMQNLAPGRMRAQAMCLLMMTSNLGNLVVAPLVVGAISDALQPRYGAESLRYAMLPLTLVGLWSAVHWWLAGRHATRRKSWMWAEACARLDEAERRHRRFYELLAAPIDASRMGAARQYRGVRARNRGHGGAARCAHRRCGHEDHAARGS
jgi:MFS family permease